MARKVYVDVVLRQDTQGRIRPLSFTWEDGRIYAVDRLHAVQRAAATKVGGCGMRYTVTVLGRETHLFFDDEKWFMEAKQ